MNKPTHKIIKSFLLLLAFALSLGVLALPGDRAALAAWRPHLMLNDEIYWSSVHPSDNYFLPQNLVLIGEVTEAASDKASKNFQGYFLGVGDKIYYDSMWPQVVFVDSGGLMMRRYATVEASMDYIYHNQRVYVALDDLNGWDLDNYRIAYEPIYGNVFWRDKLPENAVCLGDTSFVGYNRFVYNELESNAFAKPTAVYQDFDDPDMLYAGERNMIYVASHVNRYTWVVVIGKYVMEGMLR